MENWSYALLTKSAKEAGGPDSYLKMLQDAAEDKGVSRGRKEGAIVTVGVTAITAVGYKLLKKFFGKKNRISEQEVEMAKQSLINGINEYDKSHQAEQTTTKGVAYE